MMIDVLVGHQQNTLGGLRMPGPCEIVNKSTAYLRRENGKRSDS